MSKRRCWPGALAYLIDSDFPETRGALLEVLRADAPDDDGAPTWVCRAVGGPIRAWDGDKASVATEANARDDSLRPITPPPSATATDTEASRDLMARMSKLAGNPVTVD